ncbi:hypothetical protein [Streptomyces fagopyri]|uniref:hypothetical protein n=1 Tax=Streptomyces fagopyri TaxID=2662397 RepID=UPI00380E3B72
MEEPYFTDPVITQLRDQLEAAQGALRTVGTYLEARDVAAATLAGHEQVRTSPLSTQVERAIADVGATLSATTPGEQQYGDHVARLLSRVMADIDRCKHGRHTADDCDGCPGGQSAGNPCLMTGQHIGYGMNREPLYVPLPADRYKPEAWRTWPGERHTRGDLTWGIDHTDPAAPPIAPKPQ